MPLYKRPEDRASETITIRLTLKERRMLDYLAHLEGKTLTDFLKGLIADRATALEVNEAPELPAGKRPGKAKRFPAGGAARHAPPPVPASPAPLPPPAASPMPDTARAVAAPAVESVRPGSFHELVERFRETFAHRADGTRRELEETLEFLRSGRDGMPIIALETPLCTLTGELLLEIRKAVQSSDLRLAKKNLHLTYLRMMLHFGVKDPDIDLRINPARGLEPLTISEAPDSWRYFGRG
jgi:hypothetical protein